MTPSAVAATPVTLTPLLGMPEVHPGDDLAEVVVRALAVNGIRLADGDVLVVSSKIASKALGHHAPGCLLYTSPSPRDLSTSRMPSSA